MFSKSTRVYPLLLIIHLLIAAGAFPNFWMHPTDVIFVRDGDGLKNLYTLTSYVKEPLTTAGILKYNSFQYPFGDFVYYTDNVPLFSIPFRWFCHHVADVSAYAIPTLYCLVVLNIILCGLLLYYLFSRLAGSGIIPFIMAVVLPWANMMVLRIWVGHNSFSFSTIILLGIWLMLLWDKYKDRAGKQAIVAVGMCLLSFVAFLSQGYFLAICTVFSCSMLFFYGLYYRRQPLGRRSIVAAGGVGAVSLAMALLLLKLTDPYLSLRPQRANGYDWMESKVRFSGLFGHYNLHRLYFPVTTGLASDEPEIAGYLGHVGVYALLILGVAILLNKGFRAFMLERQRAFFRNPLTGGIFLGALVLLSISFGEHYYTMEPHSQALHIVNVLNPFLYIHFLTDRVEQFRQLERFIWPFFFVFNIWIVYTLVQVANAYGRNITRWIVVGCLFFGGAELADFVRVTRYKQTAQNIFNPKNLTDVAPASLQYSKYQAILPLPFYCLGIEDYDLDICDDYLWSSYNYRIATRSGLPLMAIKMSRTPVVYDKMLEQMVAYDSMNTELSSRLNDKPILVIASRRLQTDYSGINVPKTGNAAKIYAAALQFPIRHHLQAIDSLGDVLYYEWYPKRQMAQF